MKKYLLNNYRMPDPDDDGTTDPDEEETGGESVGSGGGK